MGLSSLSRWAELDGRLCRRRVALLFVALYLVFVATYLPINFFSIGREAVELWLPGERGIPFVPQAEFVYVLGYLLPILIVFSVNTPAELERVMRAAAIMLGVAYATYLLLPVYLPRPEVTVDSLATWLVSLEYQDPSYNHFPSLHVGFVWLTFMACRWRLSWRLPLFACAVAISLSTLFVRQHYVLDIAYGLGLALASWRLAAAQANSQKRPAAE